MSEIRAKYPGVLIMSDGKEKTEIKKKKKDRVKNRSVTVSALICSGEAGTRFADKTLCLLVNLRLCHLWSRFVGSD